MSKHEARKPDLIDAHVGNRIRMRRQIAKMSQEALAAELGVTFQQLQKYERASNRVSASKLYKVAIALDVSPLYFFDGLEGTIEGAATTDKGVSDFIQSKNGIKFTEAIMLLDKDTQRHLLGLIRHLAKIDDL